MLLQVVANYPYRPVFFIFSMTSRFFALYQLVPVCRLSMREKGKKRAKSVKCLISGLLVGSGLGISLRVVRAKFERVLRQPALDKPDGSSAAWH